MATIQRPRRIAASLWCVLQKNHRQLHDDFTTLRIILYGETKSARFVVTMSVSYYQIYHFELACNCQLAHIVACIIAGMRT